MKNSKGIRSISVDGNSRYKLNNKCNTKADNYDYINNQLVKNSKLLLNNSINKLLKGNLN